MISGLFDACRAHADETAGMIERLVALESPSTDKAAVDRCGRELAVMIRAAGGMVESRSVTGTRLTVCVFGSSTGM